MKNFDHRVKGDRLEFSTEMIWIIENELVLLQEIKPLRLAVQVARRAACSRFEADKGALYG